MPLAYISLGSNLPSPAGPPDATLAAAADRLASLGRIRALSSLYSTEPVGYSDQPRFLNAVVALETDLVPRVLLDTLMAIEREFGRDRAHAIPNGPRTLDLDILLWGDTNLREPGLVIPHPRMAERDFVMVPFAEIASNTEADQPQLVPQLLKSFQERSPGNSDAVIPVQSAVWRPCGSRHGGLSRTL